EPGDRHQQGVWVLVVRPCEPRQPDEHDKPGQNAGTDSQPAGSQLGTHGSGLAHRACGGWSRAGSPTPAAPDDDAEGVFVCVTHARGTSSTTVVPAPAEENSRALPPTSLSLPTTDSFSPMRASSTFLMSNPMPETVTMARTVVSFSVMVTWASVTPAWRLTFSRHSASASRNASSTSLGSNTWPVPCQLTSSPIRPNRCLTDSRVVPSAVSSTGSRLYWPEADGIGTVPRRSCRSSLASSDACCRIASGLTPTPECASRVRVASTVSCSRRAD